MRKMLMAILALAGVALLFAPRVYAQAGEGVMIKQLNDKWEVTRAARLRTSIDPGDPDTVWIGHIYDATWTAGGKMPAGGYGPYKVGRGINHPTRLGSGGAFGTTSIGDNGAWDFDRYQFTEKDSLQGWWPYDRPFLGSTTTFPDYRRAFYGLDMGNNINYVIPQGAPKRTFGVVGLWHSDRGSLTTYAPSDSLGGVTGTVAGRTNVQPVLWSPTECGGAGSTRSAWCGLRSHGDLSHRDDVSRGGTGNPFDASLIQYQSNNGFNFTGSIAANGTDANYPGYIAQLDQMLYRDVDLAEGDGLNISFNFSTNMSTGAQTATPGQVTGWFDKDPISNAQVGVGSTALPMSDGNFISSSLATPVGLVDSFMVYVGAPVDDNNVTFTADLFVGVNQITTVYDKKRRWFSEVLKIVRATGAPATTPSTIIGREILSTFGEHVAGPKTIDVGTLYPTALKAIKDADGNTTNGGRVRIVFRVKTNRGWDDENFGNPGVSYSSGTRGAAIIDNVVVNGWAAANGDFEDPNSINNDTAISATSAWKSTGKPPQSFFHIHKIAGPGSPLDFRDPCGGVDSPNRQCNMYGNVLTPGNHDATGDKEGGDFGSNLQDAQRFAISPTINLSATANGVYNDQGIDDEIARTTGDYFNLLSIYTAGMVDPAVSTAGLQGWGCQSYPARQANGSISWGDARINGFFGFNDPRQCGETFINGGLKAQSMIRTTNAQNRPDSLRLYVMRASRCFFTPTLTAAECNPTTGEHVGSYFDNVALALIDAAPPPSISSFPWNYLNDAFPSNSNVGLLPAGFDTCAASPRIGVYIASPVGSTLRNSISGDSLVISGGGTSVRMDLVFRVLPGPGNYMTIGVKASGVSQRPDGKPSGYVAATPGDGSFFGSYMANTGEFGNKLATSSVALGAGTGDANSGHPIVGGIRRWSQHVWNSARMDTVENNLFPTANDGTQIGLAAGFWAGTYHEADPKFGTLGLLKNRCNMKVPTGSANSTNILCDNSDWTAYGAGSGYPSGGEAPDFIAGKTREYTKIIPDGLLTPGSHVEYYYRKCDPAVPANFEMGPDTNFVFQQAEGGSDGHRWQEFSVLPDRWKDGAWSIADRNAASPACMLYVDYADGRGDETVWVSVADSIGATAAARFGAHNGWHARGDQDITVAIATDPTIAVYAHGGQPGTVWDMFGSKAVESGTAAASIGSRGATLGTGLRAGKDNLYGPTGDMLRQYYRTMLFLQGDLSKSTLGPITDRGDNDIALLQDFATGVAGTTRPRALWFGGRGFVESQNLGVTAHPGFTAGFFGAGLVSGDYRAFTGNTRDVIDLTTFSPTDSTGNIYGLNNFCTFTNDLLSITGPGAMAAKYEDAGLPAGNPRIASVYAPSSLPATTHPYVSLVDGWRETSIGGRNTVTTTGRIAYFFNVYSRLFGALNCPLAPGAPVSVGENPNGALVNFLALRSENPFRSDKAKISFGITRKEKVELKVYDVTGRLVKTLANREFDAGSHDLFWDGTNDEGQLVSRGVYFYQLRTPSFVSQKKLALLKN